MFNGTMSDDLYYTRLRWSSSRGCGVAKLRGKTIQLVECPKFQSNPNVVEIDYVPEVRAYRIRDIFGGWRDMEDAEVKDADKFLREITQ